MRRWGSEQTPRRPRDGETTLRSGLLGIGYVVALAALIGAVGYALALVVSWVY